MAGIRYERLTQPLAVGALLAALLGVSIPLLLGQSLFAVLGIYLAVPLTLGSLYFFFARRSGDTAVTPQYEWPPLRPLFVGYALLQAIAVLLLVTADVRPTTYFVVVALAATFVLIQVLWVEPTPSRVGLVLAQCGGIVVNVVAGVTFKYSYFFGRTDLFAHAWYAQTLIDSHRVTAAFENYQWFPLWHILAAVEQFYFGIDVAPRYLFFTTNIVVYAVLVVGMYLLARLVFEDVRIALAAALLTTINTWVVFYGLYSIPRSVVSVLCVFALCAMAARSRRSDLLVVFLTVGIVVYHTVSGPFFLVVLVTIYAVQSVFDREDAPQLVGLRHILTVVAVQLGYWMLLAPEMIDIVLARLSPPAIADNAGVGGTGADIPNPVVELANYAQFSLLLTLVVVAVLVGLRSDHISPRGKAAVLAGALLSVVSFPGPLLLLGMVGSNLNALRFGQYTFPLVVLAGAVGLVTVADSGLRVSGTTAHTVFRGLTVVLVFSLAFTAISNDFVASDNPTVEREFYTYYLSGSEVDGLLAAGELTTGRVVSDEITCKYLSYSEVGDRCTVMQVDETRSTLLTGEAPNVVLVRTDELERRGLQVVPSEDGFDPNPSYLYQEVYVGADSAVWDDLDRRDKVFATDGVSGFAALRAGNTNTTVSLADPERLAE